jgi:hypothetical protein
MAFSTYELVLLTICGIVVSMTILIVYASSTKPGSYIDRLTSKIPVISTFIIGLGIIITYQVFTVTLLSARREATYKIVDRAFTSIIKALDDNYEKCPEFINSLFYPWQKNAFPHAPAKKEKNEDKWTCTLYLASLIFQSWEDFLTDLESWWDLTVTIQYNEEDEKSWLAVFLTWAQSKELQDIFPTQQLEYNDTTVRLANLLFEYAQKYPAKNVEDVDHITDLIFADPRYAEIKNDVRT